MYICNECHETFERCASETEPHGEVLSCCPVCGSTEVEEAAYCKICGKPMCDDEMTCGVCDDCIVELLTYDSFKAFALDGYSIRECSMMEDFICQYFFGCCSCDEPDSDHTNFRAVVVRYYDEQAEAEMERLRILPFSERRFLGMIRDYVNREYKPEFADWLTKVNKGVEVIINA